MHALRGRLVGRVPAVPGTFRTLGARTRSRNVPNGVERIDCRRDGRSVGLTRSRGLGAWLRSSSLGRLRYWTACAGSACGDGQGALLTRCLEPRHLPPPCPPHSPASLALMPSAGALRDRCPDARCSHACEPLAGSCARFDSWASRVTHVNRTHLRVRHVFRPCPCCVHV